MDRINVGVIGCGYWGPNLIRNFAACPLTRVVGVCDADPARLAAVTRQYPDVTPTRSVEELLGLQLDAVAVATPVDTHYPIASQCLAAGKHVMVEKPLAGTVGEAQALVVAAERAGRVLMVDHTYLFSNPVRRIKELVDAGELGDLFFVDSVRINLGLFQRDVNVVWDLAPHDLSIVDHLLGVPPRSISAWGCAHADPGIEDLAYVNVDYGDRLMASFHVNWLSPVKIRRLMVAGSEKSLIFDELNVAEPLRIYAKGIELTETADDIRRLRVGYRSGDVWAPHIEPGEPLQAAVTHFARCVRGEAEPLTDGKLGVRVVRLLEAATRSLRAQGGRVVLTDGRTGHASDDGAVRGGHLRAGGPDRHPRAERGDPLLRQPVRVPGG